MGQLIYHGVSVYDIEDRALAHLKIVITNKLRRQESFLFSWTKDTSIGSGRTSIWMNPAIALEFRFFGNRPPELNQKWLHVLAETSHTPRGLTLINEKQAEELYEKLANKQN